MKSRYLLAIILVLLFGASLSSPLLAMGGAHATRAGSSSRHALVIGNSSYKYTAPLANPQRDARLIAAALENAGFKVRLHTDLSQKKMKRALRDFARDMRRLGDRAVSLVYYAGHGTQVAGRNYLVPIDADIETEADVPIESLAADDVLGQLENIKGALSIIILDACRNNPYKRGRRSSVRGLAPIKASKGSLIAYSTAPGTVALDGEGTNSPYATALDKFLRRPGLSIEKMFKNVRIEVDRMTKGAQTPWEESSLFGDFVFLTKKTARPLRAHTQPGTSPQSQQGARLAAETAFWNTVKDSNNPSAVESYLRAFPKGLFAPLAKIRLADQKAKRKKSLDLIKNQTVSRLLARRMAYKTRHLPRPRSAKEDCLPFYRKDGQDLYCASSVLKSQEKNKYGIASLLDDSNFTAWFEGRPGVGIGQWLTVDFGELRRVNKITLKNGYNKSEDHYYNNGRVRVLALRFSGGHRQAVTLKDQPGTQSFFIPGNISARWIQLKIRSVIKGRKFSDTGLNELRVITSPIGATR